VGSRPISRRVVVLSELFWPEGGGAELATYLATDILRGVFEVTVVTGSGNPAILPGVRYVYEPLLARREKAFLWLNMYRLARTERFKELVRGADIVYIPRLAFPAIPYVKEMGKTVVVHLHDYIPLSYSAAVLAPYEDHRHRITRDDIELECGKGVKYCLGASLLWWLPKLARNWIKLADRVICVSRRQAEILMYSAPELRDKIEVVYNPIPTWLADSKPVKNPSDTPTFLYVGGDRYVKGFHILLEALERLGRRGVNAKFLLANTYNQESLKALETLSERYKSIKINVIGRVSSHEQLLELHREAWALIFPSIWEEPLPYAVVEAMLAGTIPVASRIGGVPEIVEATLAKEYVFAPGDVGELVDRIEKLASQPKGAIVDAGVKLREHALRLFDGVEIESKLLSLFRSIMG
jgi:glycosyltransferase involved in cell wall biosynthesis